MQTIAIFHDVRSTHNVGSLFRTADCAGVEKIYLTGYTPAPIDRFGREDVSVAKVALGAEKTVLWEAGEIHNVIMGLKEDGYSVVAVEQSAQSISYTEFQPSEKVAFIFGNEVDGVSEDILSECDAVIEIPMYGKKESLNVSVAAGIILFHFKN